MRDSSFDHVKRETRKCQEVHLTGGVYFKVGVYVLLQAAFHSRIPGITGVPHQIVPCKENDTRAEKGRKKGVFVCPNNSGVLYMNPTAPSFPIRQKKVGLTGPNLPSPVIFWSYMRAGVKIRGQETAVIGIKSWRQKIKSKCVLDLYILWFEILVQMENPRENSSK